MVYEDSVVAVVNTDQFADGADTLEKYIQNLLEHVELVIGISGMFTDLVLTRTFYRQASIAMELGMEKNPERNRYTPASCAGVYGINLAGTDTSGKTGVVCACHFVCLINCIIGLSGLSKLFIIL